MDILYIIGEQSAKRNELKFSLRTIQHYCKNVGRIYISGYLPDYIDETKVTFVPCPDIVPGGKHQNILNCIKQAVLNTDISDDFLYSSDDHIYIASTDFDNYPYFCKGQITDNYESGEGLYRLQMLATRRLLEAAGLPTHNFAWHGNTHFNKTKFIEIMPLVDQAINSIMGAEPTCLMLNAMIADPKYAFEITNRNDNKYGRVQDWNTFTEMAKSRECVSFSDEAWEDGCCKEFRQRFNRPSQWEIQPN